MAAEDTLPKLLRRNYQLYGDRKAALREKDLGIWKTYTWKDYYEHVKYFSLGLISLGMQPEDKVTIIGDNKPQWFIAELAAQAARGTAVGVYPDSLPNEVKYIIDHSDSKFVVVHDQEQVDKLLFLKPELPKVQKVIYWDPKGLRYYDDPILMDFVEVEELGRRYEAEHPGLFEENIEKGQREDIGVLCYTSGTTGMPKGAMLSHRFLVGNSRRWQEADPWEEDYDNLSFLPPPWVMEQLVGVSMSLITGIKVNFPEASETVQNDMREIGPRFIVTAPRIWENMASTVQSKILDAGFIKRWLYRFGLWAGYKYVDIVSQKRQPNLFWKALYGLANLVVLRPLKDKLGLLRVKSAYTGGAPLSDAVLKFFHALGVPIKQAFGATECGAVTMHRSDDIKLETVGQPYEGVEIRISDTGEIQVKHDSLFSGYYKNPDATQKVLQDGWYYMGDMGLLDEDGHLVMIDRLEDVMQLPDGSKFSPQYIETRLKFSPYIIDAVVIGGGERPYVSALINIDFQNVGKWAEINKIPYTTFTDLSQKPEVYDLIEKEVEQANRVLPRAAKIRRFANLHKELDADEAELTRTRKLRRGFFEERYGDLVNGLFGENDKIMVSAQVKYRDGRLAQASTAVTVRDLREEAGQ
jgi:long-chain acyl-CoA synthetase